MFNLTPWRKKEVGNGGGLATQEPHPFHLIRSEFDQLFNRFFGPWPGFPGQDWNLTPWGLDVDSTDKEVVVRAEAPGFEADDFQVEVSGNLLTIQAESKEGKAENEQGLRRYRQFHRSTTLPPGVDPNQVEARYRNGILEVHLAKTPEAQGRRIPVKS